MVVSYKQDLNTRMQEETNFISNGSEERLELTDDLTEAVFLVPFFTHNFPALKLLRSKNLDGILVNLVQNRTHMT
jgi:hypothetical protein